MACAEFCALSMEEDAKVDSEHAALPELTAARLVAHTRAHPAPRRPQPAAQLCSPTSTKDVRDGSYNDPTEVDELLSADEDMAWKPHAEALQPSVAVLRASPPIPVGGLPGRYKVRLWRASVLLPWDLSLASGSSAGLVVVAEDAPHLAIRQGDEVLAVGSQAIRSVVQCTELLELNTTVELLLYHREPDALSGGGQLLPLTLGEDPIYCPFSAACIPGTTLFCAPAMFGHDATEMDPYYDPLFYPRLSQVRAKHFLMHDLLMTTGWFATRTEDVFQVQITRMSLQQGFLFGLAEVPPDGGDASEGPLGEVGRDFSKISVLAGEATSPTEDLKDITVVAGTVISSPEGTGGSPQKQEPNPVPSAGAAGPGGTDGAVAEAPSPLGTVVVQGSWAALGLLRGDELLSVNGLPVAGLAECKETIRRSMRLKLEVRRRRRPQAETGSHSRAQEILMEDGIPARWDAGLVDNEPPSRCCPPPVAARRQARESEQPPSALGWLLRGLGFTQSQSGAFCLCRGGEVAAEFDSEDLDMHRVKSSSRI